MKNFVLTAMVVLALAVGAQAAVIQSSVGTSGFTISGHTTTADTDLLLVGNSIFSNNPISGVTFNGVPLTEFTPGTVLDMRLEIRWFYMFNPGPVVGDIVGTDGQHHDGIVAYNIQDVDDISQLSAVTFVKDENVSAFSTDITISGAGVIVDMMNSDDLNGVTGDAGQTVVFNSNSAGDRDTASSYKEVASGGTYSMGWTGTTTVTDSEGIAHSVIAIVPEPATMSLLALGGLAAVLRRKR